MRPVFQLAAAALCVAAASAASAQVRGFAPSRSVASVSAAGPSRPSPSAPGSFAAPNPAGLSPVFPAGVSSGSGAMVSRDPIASSTAPLPTNSAGTAANPGVGFGTRVVPGLGLAGVSGGDLSAAAAATTVLGAGASVPGPGQTPGGAGGFSATDVARSFFFADANHDGELTHAEFNRLGIRTEGFEQMDRNFDGLITRFEYDDSTR